MKKFREQKAKEKEKNKGLELVNGQLLMSCSKCGLNQSHSTEYHEVWNGDRANFCLPEHHPFNMATHAGGLPGPTPAPTNVPTPAPTAAVARDPDLITFNRAELESKISHSERNSGDPNSGIFADFMRSMFLN